MIAKGESNIPDVEFIPTVHTIYFRLETSTVKQVYGTEKAGGKVMGQMCFDRPQRIVLQFLSQKVVVLIEDPDGRHHLETRHAAGRKHTEGVFECLWLSGSSAHPGGGIMGANGRLAALKVLAEKRNGGAA